MPQNGTDDGAAPPRDDILSATLTDGGIIRTDTGERARADAIVVLHVDDDESFLDLASTFVTRANDRLVVDTATDVEEALETSGQVDCIVSDYDMPTMNGLEFLDRVRERWPEIPFVLYTGKGSEEIASEAISAGVTDYLQKEVGTDQYEVLANRIANAVEQHRAKRGLEERERRYRVAATESFDVIWDVDLETRTVDWNDGMQDAFGFDEADVETALSWWESRIHPDDRERVVDSIEELFRDGGSWIEEYRFLDGTGSYAVVRDRGRTLPSGGRPERVMGAITDVTARRRHERRLERLHRATTELIDAETSGEAVERTVAAVDDVLGLPRACYYELAEERDALCPLEWTDEVESVLSGEPPVLRPGGPPWEAFAESRVVDDRSLEPDQRVLSDGAHELYLPVDDHGLLAIAMGDDATIDESGRRLTEILTNELEAVLDRIRREDSLEESRRQLATLISHLPGIAYRSDVEPPWPFEFIGGRVEELTGYPASAFESGEVTFGDDVISDGQAEELTNTIETAVEDGRAFDVSYQVETRDGERRTFHEHGEPVYERGTPVALEGFIMDVTDHS